MVSKRFGRSIASPRTRNRAGLNAIATLASLFGAATLAWSTGSGTAAAQKVQLAAGLANHHLEGDWVRTDLSGSGSFGGLSDKFSKAVLTPVGASMVASYSQPPRGIAYTENRVHRVGDPYIVVDRPCAGGPFGGGALGINPDSGAIHIIEQKDEVIIAPERGEYAVFLWMGASSQI